MDLAWYIPLLIYFARIGDVSVGTVRMMFVIGGSRLTASILGFFEVLIWASAVGGLIAYISHPAALIAYAAGFATGNYIGMMIEHRLSLGVRIVRVISSNRELDVAAKLREEGYRVTRVEGTGRGGAVEIAFAVVKRRALNDILRRIETIAPEAIVTVERAEHASAWALSANGSSLPRRGGFGLGGVRK